MAAPSTSRTAPPDAPVREDGEQQRPPSAAEPQDGSLAALELSLRVAEDELWQLEQRGLNEYLTPRELLVLAAEHDRIARDRDSVAAAYDERATARDRLGLARDVAGSGRDRAMRAVSKDRDAGFADRFVAGKDRDFAAGDRTDSHEDRTRSRRAREHAAADRSTAAADRGHAAEQAEEDAREVEGLRAALETRATIAQAQGLLMARHDLAADAAFALLVQLSQRSNVKLREVAARMVEDFERDRESRSAAPGP